MDPAVPILMLALIALVSGVLCAVVASEKNREAGIWGVNGGEIMYHRGGSSAEVWRLKTVPPVAFNQERQNLIEGGLDVPVGNVPTCSKGLLRRRDECS